MVCLAREVSIVKSDYLRKATVEDAAYLSENLREADLNEIKHSGTEDPKRCLILGLLTSKPCLSLIGAEGELLGIMGIQPLSAEKANVWALLTDDIKDNKVLFCKESLKVIKQFNERWPSLVGTVDTENKTHVRWLQLMGFKFQEPRYDHGIGGHPFCDFERRSDV